MDFLNMEGFTMTTPDQAKLDAYAQDIAQRAEKVLRAYDEPVGQTLHAMAERVVEIQAALAPVRGYGDDATRYPFAQAFEAICTRSVDHASAIADLTAKVDALLARGA